MGILKRLSLAAKLGTMLGIPLFALALFSIQTVAEKARRSAEMADLEQLAQLAVHIGDLVHELQKERGASAGFIASAGESFGSELSSFRSHTDSQLPLLRTVLDAIGTRESLQLGSHLAEAESRLGGLDATRDAVSAQTMSAEDVADFYSALDHELLALIDGMALSTSDAELAQRLTAYTTLLERKEHAGLERAVLSNVFSKGRFTATTIRQLGEVIGRQQAFEEVFLHHARPEHQKLYERKTATKAAQRVAEMEAVAFAKATTGDFGIDALDWFRTMTTHINNIKEVEEAVHEDLTDAAATARTQARSTLVMVLLATIAAMVVVVILGFLMARTVSRTMRESAQVARALSQQIVAAAQQQAASTSETAAAVSETTTTVEEIRQTSEMTTHKARVVSEVSERSQSVSSDAKQAIRHSIEGMQRIRVEVEGIARNILQLSEKNIEIGEIVQSVNAIAEQSNLLAVNASIEAAKAGVHGKGFSVVASEVKALAGQSKEATTQIRRILSDIQKSSNAAVMVTEQGTKRVEEGTRLIEQVGTTIEELSRSIEENADVAVQISSAANQQLAGVEQISSAMRNVETGTRDNAESAQQMETAARQLLDLSAQLEATVAGARASA